eukprot:CAMPEP_0172512082 /NCGR_PEP_ID=MMETSP1066-20121228/241554_1 /TAXON_ID=671091 /ORGANISM="Coscinodiscus wailesii, Strain CCMP2513" /LENGTH=48 /DNA_ID= /DNA_START= /DNA_END= /DNA_ORIENTATION=
MAVIDEELIVAENDDRNAAARASRPFDKEHELLAFRESHYDSLKDKYT